MLIERFVTSLDWLVNASPAELSSPGAAAALGDCADAVRLQLDCMQLDRSRELRDALQRLSDLLEENDVAPHRVIDAARRASEALGR